MQKKFTRIMSLFLAVSMFAGIALGLFAIWPPLLLVLLAVVAIIIFIWRYRRNSRG